MTDYNEEQQNEIEAIQSIYPQEYNEISSNPRCFSIEVKTEDYGEDSEDGAMCEVKFTFTECYPDEVPYLEIVRYANIDDEDKRELEDYLQSQASENIGMVMVFTLVSALQEQLNVQIDERKRRHEEEQTRIKEEKEKEEKAKFEGTRLTVQSFLDWHEKFLAETRSSSGRPIKNISGPKKLTGKELFLQDTTLNESDIQFLDGNDADEIKVDESLFEDFDDLELEEELENS